MSKPTKYQIWWMGAILDGRKSSLCGLMRPQDCRYHFKINPNSFRNAVKKGWIEFSGEFAKLTLAGRKALEE